jgi:hypothetical protein
MMEFPGGPIDFNFYPEKHMDELDDLLDIELPAGWTLAQLIEAIYDAKIMLWAELLDMGSDGNVKWR